MMLAKTLEFEHMNVAYNYTTKEMTIQHTNGNITFSPSDIRDLREALESIGQQTPEGRNRR